MISYAQNFEDVILARAFGGRRDGFYVDIGACWPDVDSVTRHFYEAGWSGVNVEPMAEPFARLRAQRPRDTNLQVAIAASDGEAAMYEGPTVGESSLIHRHGGTPAVVVPCMTLASLCEQHVTQPIDFLKVDVEGAEIDVIAGGDWKRFRPSVVVVEVTEQWSTTRREDSVEVGRMLAAHGYREVYFDGLNAFFVASEAESLAGRLAVPPNVLDRFRRAHEVALEQAVEGLQQRLRHAGERAREAETTAAAAVRAQHEATLRLQHAVERQQEAVAQAEAAAASAAASSRRADELATARAQVEAARDAERERGAAFAREAQRAAEEAVAERRQRARADDESRTAKESARLAELRAQAAEAARAAAMREASDAAQCAERAEARVADAQARVTAAERAAHEALLRAAAADAQARGIEAYARHVEQAYRSIEDSRSWRLTAPLRHVRTLFRSGPEERGLRAADERRSGALARVVVATGMSATRRLGIYPTVAAWLRTRHPRLWARAKGALIDGPGAPAIPRESPVHPVFQTALPPVRAPETDTGWTDLDVDAIKDRIRAAMRRTG